MPRRDAIQSFFLSGSIQTFTRVFRRTTFFEPLPLSGTNETRVSGQCKSFPPLLTRYSRTPEARSRDSGVRASAMYSPSLGATPRMLTASDPPAHCADARDCNARGTSLASAGHPPAMKTTPHSNIHRGAGLPKGLVSAPQSMQIQTFFEASGRWLTCLQSIIILFSRECRELYTRGLIL